MASPMDPAVVPGTFARPPTADLVWLGIAVLFISSSGPLIAAMAAPALASRALTLSRAAFVAASRGRGSWTGIPSQCTSSTHVLPNGRGK